MDLVKQSEKTKKLWRGRPVRHLDSIAQRRFRRYSILHIREVARRSLADESVVEVRNPGDILNFLFTCEYASDREVHGRDDVWCTPAEFEKLRKGDCEDFALWAWKMMLKIGFDARLFLGTWNRGGHAWVVFYVKDEPMVFETTGVGKLASKEALKPAEQATGYLPNISIDGRLRFYQHINQ